MSTGKESPEHKSAVEALSLRLRQLYPEAVFTTGQQHPPTGLKPDIYVRHPDGREWAYEVVYGNHNLTHLRENHARYQQAGVREHWILWDTLQPGQSQLGDNAQGFFPTLRTGPRIYPLNGLHRTLLETQSGSVRWLWAFTFNSAQIQTDLPLSAMTQLLLVGLDAYRFDGWNDETEFPAKYEFASISDLTFSENGVPVIASADDPALREIASRLGFDLNAPMIPAELLAQFNQMVSTGEGWKQIVQAGLVWAVLQAKPTPEEQQELMDFFQSGKAASLPQPETPVNFSDMAQIAHNPQALAEVAQTKEKAREYYETLPIPSVLRRALLAQLDSNAIEDMTHWLEWQKNSSALRQARQAGQESVDTPE